MSKILTMILTLLAISVFGQKKLKEETLPVVAEGKILYKSEMASWYGTDLFVESYLERANIGGYFSYHKNDTAKCVFFSKAENPMVIGTISFDSTYNKKTAKTDLTERGFTTTEKDLYQMWKSALTELQTNKDGFFKFYPNTNPNIIPLIHREEKKVYILTGPQQSGVVIFGNDYVLTFDDDNQLVTKKQLHKNIIPIQYGNMEASMDVEAAMHSHLPETGDFITATDICTLMLYEKFAKWKTHNVVSEKYLNIWNCETDQLTVIPMSTVKKIKKDQEKRKNKE